MREAGLFYLIMTHAGTAFIILTFLLFLNKPAHFPSRRFGIQTSGCRTAYDQSRFSRH